MCYYNFLNIYGTLIRFNDIPSNAIVSIERKEFPYLSKFTRTENTKLKIGNHVTTIANVYRMRILQEEMARLHDQMNKLSDKMSGLSTIDLLVTNDDFAILDQYYYK